MGISFEQEAQHDVNNGGENDGLAICVDEIKPYLGSVHDYGLARNTMSCSGSESQAQALNT